LACWARRGGAKRRSRRSVARQPLAAQMYGIDDYLSWVGATQMNCGSGDFTGYLRVVDQSQVPAPRRHDPLSVYVDALEDQFENWEAFLCETTTKRTLRAMRARSDSSCPGRFADYLK